MPTKIKKRIIIIFFLALYLVFLILKIIVILNNSEFVDFNARNASRIENIISLKQNYSFIAVGDIRNSLGIFKKKLLPLINASDADFVVFLGDTVLDGANDKYAAFYRNLGKLIKPAVFTLGDTEMSDGGITNYFKHIGAPLFFFIAGKSEFVFLDTTGYTKEKYQINWLIDLLDNVRNVSNRFIFMNRSPVLKDNQETGSKNHYTMNDAYKHQLLTIFSKAHVSAVISSSDGIFNQSYRDGVIYLSTGGGGGTMDYKDKKSFFHCSKIDVNNGAVSISLLKPKTENLPDSLTFFDYLWTKIYSLVYVYFINVIFVISVLFLTVYLIYTKLIERIDYYPDFAEPIKKDYPLTIAMFTDNYLPFIGGVPLSISRLKQGLEAKGHRVFVFAPQYGTIREDKEESVIRCSPLFYYKKKGLIIPVSNVFSSKIKNEFKKINPDIVHVHHPYWLGSVGKKLAKKYKKPVVFTYHTRLEQYNHNVPVFHRLAGGQIPHMLIKFFASGCDAVVAPTRTAKQYLRNLGIGKLILVQPTGVDLQLFDTSHRKPVSLPVTRKSGKKLILFSVFRLSKEKKPYFLLEGIEKLSRLSSIPFLCFIAGTGPEETAMNEYIKDHNLRKFVVMLGNIPPEEIPHYYSMADIFIFSSQSETQGMVILEAMAAGTPVVAVNSSGISDIVTNGINGFKTESDVNKWVNKIRKLLENTHEREKMGKHALLTAKTYSIENMSGNILEMYYEIIDWKEKHPFQTFIR